MSNPLVTIYTPVFNGEAYLAEAIRSVLNQSYTNFEYIIINDGSTDQSKKIIESFDDNRIKYFENISNRGLIYTRNKALEIASGDFITILDCDDLMASQRIEYQLNFLLNNSDFGLVTTWVKEINTEGDTITQKQGIIDYSEIPTRFLFGNPIAQSSVMCPSMIIKSFGYREGYAPSEDFDLWIRISQKYKIGVINSFLTSYRIHGDNISFRMNEVQKNARLRIINEYLLSIGENPDEKFLRYHHQILTFTVGGESLFPMYYWITSLKNLSNISDKIIFTSAIESILVEYVYKNLPGRLRIIDKLFILRRLRLFSITNLYLLRIVWRSLKSS